ncbi:Uncharacterised protein [[Flavobacterium] thermophilum]|nr:Uncharacterised protein [[Flavobacterium] thermophilum]
MEKKVEKFIPLIFQKVQDYEANDTRFTKVKIWLMHIHENLNGSYFSKEVVTEAIPTLANTPILAFIEENSDGEIDFSDHRMVLVKKDGEISIKYLGQAIGVIPSDNNAHFETRLCDDGIEREFLVCEGLIWNKWDDPIDIFNRDVVKWQSMELHDDYEGYWGDDGLFHFTKFKFFGACALGKDVLPAMHNATIEAQFSYNDIFKEIQEKMEQFKAFSQEGGQVMEDNKNVKTDNKTNFALTAGQLRDEIRAELHKVSSIDEWGYEYHRYWYVDHTDNLVIAEDGEDSFRLVGFNYTVENDKVTIDFESKKRVRIVYELIENDTQQLEFNIVSKDRVEYNLKVKEKELEQTFSTQKDEEVNKVKQEFTSLEEKYNKLEQEVNELRQFKSNKLAEERAKAEQELYERFSAELTEEEIEEVKAVASEYTLEQLEEKLFTLVGKKKANFSKQTKKEKQPVKIALEIETKEKTSRYGDLFERFGTK